MKHSLLAATLWPMIILSAALQAATDKVPGKEPDKASGKVIVRTARNDRSSATAAFSFKNMPQPVHGDAATKATFRMVDGRRDRNGGDIKALHDSRLPGSEDAPAQNFFFAANTDGGRLMVDLGKAVAIKQVNTFSWHPGARGPQVYTLYGAVYGGQAVNLSPKRNLDPEKCGWRRIASVDTRPKSGGPGGQYAVSIGAAKAKKGDAAENTIGTYRHLLLDIRRTESSDPFGNTFFSEIDIIDSKAPVCESIAARAPKKIIAEVTAGPNKIFIDVTDTPDLTDWVCKKLAPVIHVWYPKIIAMLPGKGFTAPREVLITFSNTMKGVAAASGNRVWCAAKWYRQNLKGEAIGSVVHELVHVVQQYRRPRQGGRRTPGWVVEGIADYIRWFLYEPETRGAEIPRHYLPRARYDASYRISANFIDWVVRTQSKDIVKVINAAAREGRYSDDLWEEKTGKTLKALGEAWKKALAEKLDKSGR